MSCTDRRSDGFCATSRQIHTQRAPTWACFTTSNSADGRSTTMPKSTPSAPRTESFTNGIRLVCVESQPAQYITQLHTRPHLYAQSLQNHQNHIDLARHTGQIIYFWPTNPGQTHNHLRAYTTSNTQGSHLSWRKTPKLRSVHTCRACTSSTSPSFASSAHTCVSRPHSQAHVPSSRHPARY